MAKGMRRYRRFRPRYYRRSRTRRYRRSLKRHPRDVLGYCRALRTSKSSDTYTTNLVTLITADQFWTLPQANSVFGYRNLNNTLLTLCQGYADLAARFNCVKINSAYIDITIANIAAAGTSNNMVGYFPSSQFENISAVNLNFFENAGVQTKTFNPQIPKVRFKLAGTLMSENFGSAGNPGYTMTNAHGVYLATGTTGRLPDISYGQMAIYYPATNVNAAPSNTTCKITFNVSFASPILNRTA